MKFFRPSFLFSTSVTFLLGYAVLDIGHFVFSNLTFYEEFQRKRIVGMIQTVDLGHTLLHHDETEFLKKRLQESLTVHDIDFYFLKKKGKVIDWDSTDPPLEELLELIPEGPPGQKNFDGPLPYIAFRQGPYQLAVGISPRRVTYMKLIFEEHRLTLFFDISLVVILASAIAFFYFNDIRRLIKALKSPGKPKLSTLKPAIVEANVMLKGIKSYETHVHRLQQRQGILSRHIASALRTELDSGRIPPYQFRCTMVRTDINQYSTIYSEHPVEEFMSVINDFFSRASTVIARYNGYVTDFVGDEIIYYFKDDDHENSAAIAAAAIRDIHDVAKSIHALTSKQMGYPFTVKSAMACGSLRFGPHVSGFSLSGGVFVETVRILSQVDEKMENSAYLPSRLAHRIGPVSSTKIRKTVTLKGIPGETELYRITEYVPIEKALSDLDDENTRRLIYYRSPSTVIQILDAAREVPPELGMGVLKSLTQISYPFSEPEVAEAYLAFVHDLMSRDRESAYLLSFSITLSKVLVSRENYQHPMQEFLKQCLQASERRTVANAVEAMIHFEPDRNNEVLLKLLKHPDNRVAANTLIKMGMLNMGREVISGLNEMLDSNKPLFMASAAYAIGMLAQFHRNENPLLLETHGGFRLLMRKVRALSNHPDPMVQRQSRNAQDKFKPLAQAA
jgi:class 3 adenylate cyclase